MSLVRIKSRLSEALINKLGVAGGVMRRDLDPELDNIITGVNSIEAGTTLISNAIYCIHHNITPTGNVGTGVDDLHSFTLPAGTLATNGDYLTVDYGGQFAANDNDKRVLALFDGTTYEDGLGGPQDLDGGSNNAWRFFNKIIRVSSTQVRVFSMLAAQFIQMNSAAGITAPGAAGFLHLNRDLLITLGGGANLNANSVIMKVQGESATATNDNIVQHMSTIELRQQ